MIPYFEVSGTDYEIGFQIGQKFKEYLSKIIGKYDKVVNKVYDKIKHLEQKCKILLPNCLDEIYGRADGANISRDSMLLLFFPEIFKQIDGCTTVILKKDNGVLFAHNEDQNNCTNENTALIKYIYKDKFIIAHTRADRLAGSAFSFNSYGLLISSNYVYGESLNLENLSRYIVVRDVINSKSIEEAKQKLKIYDVASAFSLNILNMNTNEVVNVEKDIHDVYITDIKDKYARSNHFHAKSHDETKDPVSSKFRYTKSNELLKELDIETSNVDEILNILKYETDDYCKTIYKNHFKYSNRSTTIATLYTDTRENEICILDYIGRSKIVLNKSGKIVQTNKMFWFSQNQNFVAKLKFDF